MSRVSVTARAHREGRFWVVDVAGYGVTQAERLPDIDLMARDYVACMDDVRPEDVDVSLTIDLPAGVAEAKKAREAADAANADAARKTRAVVQDLKRQGWQVREIAAALGVTTGRVSQLTSSGGGGQRPATARPAAVRKQAVRKQSVEGFSTAASSRRVQHPAQPSPGPLD